VATDAGEWELLVKALPLNGMSRQMALHCALAGRSDGHYELVLDKKMAQMHQPRWADVLSEALSTHFGRAVKATIQLGEPATETPDQARQRRAAAQQQAAEQSVADDPLVKAMLDRFDGRIEPGSIRPDGMN
jgi:DNA polymerase-3 subunit gamma/tau